MTVNIYHKYKEQILYLFFGISTTLVNWVSYTLFLSFLNLTASNTLAWFIAVLFAFFTNRKYVFKNDKAPKKNMLREMLLFFGARIFSGLFEILGLPLLVYLGLNQTAFGIEGAIAKAIISIIVVLSNYFFSKFIVFK